MDVWTAQVVTYDRWDGDHESNSRINPGARGLRLGVVAWDPGWRLALSPLLWTSRRIWCDGWWCTAKETWQQIALSDGSLHPLSTTYSRHLAHPKMRPRAWRQRMRYFGVQICTLCLITKGSCILLSLQAIQETAKPETASRNSDYFLSQANTNRFPMSFWVYSIVLV